jgi:PAP2 superfamily protein
MPCSVDKYNVREWKKVKRTKPAHCDRKGMNNPRRRIRCVPGPPAAAVIASEYHDKAWIKVAAYGVAGAVSVARFTEHKHYVSDVVVGSVAGYAIGKYVYRAHHREAIDSTQQDSTKSHWPMIMPQYAHHHYGARLTWTFQAL